MRPRISSTVKLFRPSCQLNVLFSLIAAVCGGSATQRRLKYCIRLFLCLEFAATPLFSHCDDLLDHLGGVVWFMSLESKKDLSRLLRCDSARKRSPRSLNVPAMCEWMAQDSRQAVY